MKANHVITAAIALILTIPNAAWAMFPEEELTTDKSVYFRGELVDISLNVSNTGIETILLWTGMCGCTAFDVEVIDSTGTMVSSYIDPYMCVAVPCAYPFEAGFVGDLMGDHTYYDWNQSAEGYNNFPGSTGPLVPPGEYVIRVVWHDGTDLFSPEFEILAQAPQVPTASRVGLIVLGMAIGLIGTFAVRRCR